MSICSYFPKSRVGRMIVNTGEYIFCIYFGYNLSTFTSPITGGLEYKNANEIRPWNRCAKPVIRGCKIQVSNWK